MSKYKSSQPAPPRWVGVLLRWLFAAHLVDELEGDLDELFQERIRTVGLRSARWRYAQDVLSLIRPRFIKELPNRHPSPNPADMLQNYLKIGWRNLVKHYTSSVINIAGLAIGTTTTILIGLWVWDELSYNRYHEHYDRIARVMQHQTFNGSTSTTPATPLPMRMALEKEYGSAFRYMSLSSWTEDRVLAYGDHQLSKKGNCVEADFPLMMSLKMLGGAATGLDRPDAMLLSESVAKALFGDQDPLNKIVRVDNLHDFRVAGIFEDLPYATEFRDVSYLLPWKFYTETEPWIKRSETNWSNNSFLLLAEIAPNTSFEQIGSNIENIKARHAPDLARFSPRVFLHPMSRWHLYSEWENGVSVRGRIQFVWLFSIIGGFVLLLACINFMNLSTARSQKRAKEVGVRKAAGSLRTQLITQFLTESILTATIAFAFGVGLAYGLLPWFNRIADKQMTFPWANGLVWATAAGLMLLTGLLAGSYPALFLSGFQPAKVLKGKIWSGRFAALPRKALVVVQFTVSITLVTGTVVVIRQIQHARNRPAGFERTGLLSVAINTSELRSKAKALKHDLMQTGAVTDVTESSSPLTEVWSSDASFSWPGKDPGQLGDFGYVGVTPEYGRTVGWRFKEGRDFADNSASEALEIVIDESAAKFMGVAKPVGTMMQWNGLDYTIVGVIRDVVNGSPFMSVRPTVFLPKKDWALFIHVRLNPSMATPDALSKLEDVFRKHNPGSPFDYRFASDEYDRKFKSEDRIGELSTIFACLAIFISCLGLYGLASFFAEQRQKEIGIRKVLGASVASLWQMLSRDFVLLVAIAGCISVPIAYHFMQDWLAQYTYKISFSWWIFAIAILGALVIALITVSFQAVKAAVLNPVRVLKND